MQDYFNCLVIIPLIFFILTQNIGNAFGQNYEDSIRITGDFIVDDNEFTENTYSMIKFSFSYSNGSQMCPSNSCIFEFQDAWISNMFSPNDFVFNGVLRVGTPDSSGGAHYKVYDARMDLKIIETTERPGAAIHKVTGTVSFGEFGETVYEIYDGTLSTGGSYVQLDVKARNPSLVDSLLDSIF
jgi:hypothetical protein